MILEMRKHLMRFLTIWLTCVSACILVAQPDYTKGEPPTNPDKPQALGPIGVMANMEGGGANATGGTRMMLVQKVEEGSPAARVLQVGDVIVGVGGTEKFQSDCRKVLSAAITEAEKRENGGKLVLTIWRKGKTMPVTVKLPVMGTYSATSPWECEKTEKLIKEACKSLMDRGVGSGIGGCLDGLGLLATGDKKYHGAVGDRARRMAKRTSGGSWDAGYRNLFLTEYYLATKDSSVLPGIKALSGFLARGQSGVGTWGHGMAYKNADGSPHGAASGYGCMNQCSITCAMSLILAQKCGIRDSEVDEAVLRSVTFLRWYVDKGTVPYGDHDPAQYHDNNGRNSQTAVLFDIYGDREAADFFTRMTLASSHEREGGHTGHFFADLWGQLGAARGGPEAAHAFAENQRWYTELERRPGGNYVYQRMLRYKGTVKYGNWNATGLRLIQLCLPRKKLHITGKGGSCVPPISGEESKAAVDAGVFNPSGLTSTQLLDALGSWSPIVRGKAAKALAGAGGISTGKVKSMLKGSNRYARYGALQAIAACNMTDQVDLLVDVIEEEKDITLRYFAAKALAPFRMRRSAEKPMLRLIAKDLNDEPQGRLTRVLGQALFASRRAINGMVEAKKFDRSSLVPAIRKLLRNPNGGVRSNASLMFRHLTEKELAQLWGEIYVVTKYKAPAGAMFSFGARANGLEVMARHHVKEGVDLGVNYVVREDGWGKFRRVEDGFPALMGYGKALEPYREELNKQISGWEEEATWRKMLENALNKPVQLKSVQKSIDAVGDKPFGVQSGGIGGGGDPGSPRFDQALAKATVPKPAPTVVPVRKARSISPESMAILDRALESTLQKLSAAGKLKEVPLGLSMTRSKVWLKSASDENVTFQLVGGVKSVSMKVDELKLSDRATLSVLVARLNPHSNDAQAMAAVYMECIGRVKEADKYFGKAGDDSRAKLEKLFVQ